MKRIVAGMACSFLLITNLYAADSVAQREAARISQDVGRYQLFQGQYTIYDLKRGGQSTTTIFLIDTATGLVRRYINKIDDDGKNIEAWVPTDLPIADKKK
jgi:opacity protein-like surface antigen